uniref:Uncharacterized protein n=1 Tax=Cacopsylla melanoneura TaxID=428564 RepID=A0A8D8UD81_9HEMI
MRIEDRNDGEECGQYDEHTDVPDAVSTEMGEGVVANINRLDERNFQSFQIRTLVVEIQMIQVLANISGWSSGQSEHRIDRLVVRVRNISPRYSFLKRIVV